MVRLLLIPLCLVLASRAFASDELYFSDSQKALIALLLKTTQTGGEGSAVEPISTFKTQAGRLKKIALRIKDLAVGQATGQFTPEVIQVGSFEEFLEKEKSADFYDDDLLEEMSDEALLKRLRPVRYASSSMRVQRKIEAYESARIQKFQKLPGFLGERGLQLARIEQINLENIRAEVKRSFDEQVARLTSALGEKNSTEVTVLIKMLKAYFKALPSYQKTEILFRITQLPMNSNPLDLFLVMIQNAGPQLQKLVQILGHSDAIPDQFKQLFQKLENQVRPVPWRKVKAILEKNGVSLNEFVYFERKPIGVGTMAQTHRVQFINERGQRQSGVIRFLKPDVEKYLEMDHQILIKITREIDHDPELQGLGLPSMSDVVEDLHNSVLEELDLAVTVKNQNRARQIYLRSQIVTLAGQKNSLDFVVPQASLYKGSKNLMLQDLVFGKKPAKEFSQFEYQKLYPNLYREAAEKIAETWVEEAFFRSGFFHADLHQGNLLASVTDEAVRISILDFGMVGQLDRQLQKSALLLALGIKLQKADVIADSFLKLSRMKNDGLTTPNLLALVQNRIDAMKTDATIGGSLEQWTAWALDQGIVLHYEFLKFKRGMTAILLLLSDSKSHLNLEKLAAKSAVRNKKFMADVLRDSKFSVSDYRRLALKVFEKEAPAESPLPVVRCAALF